MQYEPKSKPPQEEREETNRTQEEYEGKTEPEESFSFLRETIKPKTMSRETIFIQLARMAVYGLIIGIFACCSFFALKPWAEQTFGNDKAKVEIPEDEEPAPEDEQSEAEAEPETQTLDEESYRQIMDSLYRTAKEAKKCVVSVSAKTEADWTEEYDRAKRNAESSAGLIAADNGRELLILADSSVCEKGSEWEVLFADGSRTAAALKKQDRNRKLAVFSIPRNTVSDSTWNQIKVAELGNSNIVTQGDSVIALGNMFGYEEGLGYGVVSSVKYSEIFPDGQCRTVATDIAAAQTGTGVLFDQDGAVIGLIRHDILGQEEAEAQNVTANALAISDLKPILELMLNGKSVPYAGIYGVTVTGAVSEEQGIPEGLYVTRVDGDSPAMEAGIQNGDVIQTVGDVHVTGITSFENALLGYEVGETVKVQGVRRGSGGFVDVTFSLNVGSSE